jgi:hypothetical protein
MPCEGVRPLLQSPPGSSRGRRSTSSPVQVTQFGLSKGDTRRSVERITPLPHFGIDGMGDFRRVGAASLWKSAPIFSTGKRCGGAPGRGASVEPAVAANAIHGSLRRRGSGKGRKDLATSCPQHLQSPAGFLPQRQWRLSTSLEALNPQPPASGKTEGGMS